MIKGFDLSSDPYEGGRYVISAVLAMTMFEE